MSVTLVIIDPQVDFCDKNGTLYVPGSEDDCSRLAEWIIKNKHSIDKIHITMDAHPAFHIAHPVFWVDKNGNNPEPYTVITYQSLIEGTWAPAVPELKQRTEDYLLELETKGHYNLIIWPPHCLTATHGCSVVPIIMNAVRQWELAKIGRNVTFVQKTSNPFTEHYSAVQAEVPDKTDPTTRVNFNFIDSLKDVDEIYVAGEAFSHCVSNTLRDLIAYIPSDRITILSDCTSNVQGFDQIGDAMLKEFGRQGMKISKSTTNI